MKSVACWDLGEFARLHPRGRMLEEKKNFLSFFLKILFFIFSILQQIGVKYPLMELMDHKDSEVRKQALLAVQKLLVTHWEYLH